MASPGATGKPCYLLTIRRPSGPEILGAMIGEIFGIFAARIHHPDVTEGLPSDGGEGNLPPIARPCGVTVVDGVVCYVVQRISSRRHSVDFKVSVSIGGERYFLTAGVPVRPTIFRLMVRELSEIRAVGIDDIDINVLLDFGMEGELVAVR